MKIPRNKILNYKNIVNKSAPLAKYLIIVT